MRMGRCRERRKRVSEGGNIMWNNLSLVYEGLGQEGENKVKQMTSQESVKIGWGGLTFRLWVRRRRVQGMRRRRDGDEGGRGSVRVLWEGETVKEGAEIDAVNNGLISHPLLGKMENVKKNISVQRTYAEQLHVSAATLLVFTLYVVQLYES